MRNFDGFVVARLKKLLNEQSTCWWYDITFIWRYCHGTIPQLIINNGTWCNTAYSCKQRYTINATVFKKTKIWTSYQIRKIAGCACAEIAGNVYPPPRVSDPDMHHGTCVTHVPRCMPGSLTSGFIRSQWRGNFRGIPGACTIRNFTYLVRGPLCNTTADCKCRCVVRNSEWL